MRIGIDARCLEEENISGVGEYALELIKNLLDLDRQNRYILFSNSFREISKNLALLEKYPNAVVKKFRFPNKIFNLSLWYIKRPKIDALIGGVDVFFMPNINFFAFSTNCPLVATFHDLSFERFPEHLSLKSRSWHNYFVEPRRIVARAEKVISVSESTKRDLEEIYRLPSEKIDVIYHGIGADYRIIERNDSRLSITAKKYGLPEKFLLYLGTVEPRKNIASLLSAYIRFRQANPSLAPYKLVLCGNISEHCRNLVREAQQSEYGNDILFTGYIDEIDKAYVYNLASVFVYPSFFEGFGLPLLEAMACGIPVITSNTSSIPEVVGDAAITVDPARPDEISQAFHLLLSDEKLYGSLREKGLQRTKLFNWQACARKTLQVFENIKKQPEGQGEDSLAQQM